MYPRLKPIALVILTMLNAPAIEAARARLPDDVPAAWESTRRYLEQRVLEAPNDVRARLALAQHQMTRASTLRSGIVQLSLLANDREVGPAAIESWRDALAWTEGLPSDAPLYQAYLRVRPRDEQVRARLAAIARNGGGSVAMAPLPPEAQMSPEMAQPLAYAPPPAYAAVPGYAPAPAYATAPAYAPAPGYPPAAAYPQAQAYAPAAPAYAPLPPALYASAAPVAAPVAQAYAPVAPAYAPAVAPAYTGPIPAYAPLAAPAPAPAARAVADNRSPAVRAFAQSQGLDPSYVPAPAPAVLPAAAPVRAPLFAQAAAPIGPAAIPVAPASGAPLLGSDTQVKVRGLQDEIDAMERGRGAQVTVGTVVRYRQGEKGMGQLTDTEIPIALRFDLGDGKATISVTPVVLNTGTPATDSNTMGRFGAGPVLAAALPGASGGSQDTAGVGLGLAYEQGNVQGDIGTTPLGFRKAEVIGGVKVRLPVSDEFSFSIGLSRRPLTDSVLAFAGLKDQRTGTTWGGVTANGGRIDATLDEGSFGIYGYGSLHRVVGDSVATNTRGELGAGTYWRIVRSEDATLTAGLAASVLSFDKNLSNFTYGQGGYFSPQQFISLAVPVEWQARSNRLAYRVNGSLGVQHVRTDSSAYFPLDPSLQALTNTFYSGTSKTGLGYGLGFAMEYQLDPQWYLGGQVAVDNARDYRQFVGGIYLKYMSRPQRGPIPLPVSPVRSPYASY